MVVAFNASLKLAETLVVTLTLAAALAGFTDVTEGPEAPVPLVTKTTSTH
jgi:hypothetical protein